MHMGMQSHACLHVHTHVCVPACAKSLSVITCEQFFVCTHSNTCKSYAHTLFCVCTHCDTCTDASESLSALASQTALVGKDQSIFVR